jgi:acyl-CoA dehydrogenase
VIGHRPVYDQDHKDFRASVRRFLDREIAPHFQAWEEAGIVDRDLWLRAGRAGMLCPQVPEEYGGTGDFRFNAVLIEECSYAGYAGPAGNFTAHSDVACGYVLDFGSEAIRKTWLPRMLSGEAVCSIAMSEPAAGSDLQGLLTRAGRDGDEYVLNGQKTFISNGQHCDIAVVVARTAPSAGPGGMSLFLVEADRPGFTRGRNLDKLGHHCSDTSELSFVNTRTAFGKTIGSMQNTRFSLADLKADLSVGWAYVDQCLAELTDGSLTTERASIAKLWVTEMQGRLVDRCLQFFGGYGFMREYEISRLYADARVQRIYGGTSEIMREIIARSL